MIKKNIFNFLVIFSMFFLTGCKKNNGDCKDNCTNICNKEISCENGECPIDKNNSCVKLEEDSDYISIEPELIENDK